MRIEALSIGDNPPYDVNVIVEVPVGGAPIKYEFDKPSGALVVDRFLNASMRYPCNYGFVPHTLSLDGDPVDVLVAGTPAVVPGAVMACRPVGVLLMEDEAGMDEKIIAVPPSRLNTYYDSVQNYTDLPKMLLDQIEHFFNHYKALEKDKWVKLNGWGDASQARGLIEDAITKAKG
ncbi:MAG: inorganic diphosphatase [Candidatus Phaeomarinobacter sp.]